MFLREGNKMKNKWKLFFQFILFTFFILCFFNQFHYAAESIIKGISAKRTGNGGIIIFGKVNLPKGTKIMLDLLLSANKIAGQSDLFLKDDGAFESGIFTNKGNPYTGGKYRIKIYSYFTSRWQSKEVLLKVGENGILLKNIKLTPDDPEFPNNAKHLEQSFVINFPDLSPEINAIQAVNDAVLDVVGKGRSADPIRNVVQWFNKAGGFTPQSWSAKKDDKGNFVVTLDCIDAGNKKKAQWSFNPKTREVKYLDPLAKLLSWLPAE
jgi:hypothetical protein